MLRVLSSQTKINSNSRISFFIDFAQLVYLFCFLNFSINKYIMNPTETANRKIDPLIK